MNHSVRTGAHLRMLACHPCHLGVSLWQHPMGMLQPAMSYLSLAFPSQVF